MLNLGIFNKNKVYIQYTSVKSALESEIKKVIKTFKNFGKSTLNSNQNGNNNTNSNINNLNNYFVEDETISIDEIYKKSEIFGENIVAMVNFFNYNKEEKNIEHIIDGLNIIDLIINENNSFQKEFYFENFSRFFKKIENYCNKGEIPHEFDIFTTKHSNSNSFDVLLNIFIKKERLNESDLESCI